MVKGTKKYNPIKSAISFGIGVGGQRAYSESELPINPIDDPYGALAAEMGVVYGAGKALSSKKSQNLQKKLRNKLLKSLGKTGARMGASAATGIGGPLALGFGAAGLYEMIDSAGLLSDKEALKFLKDEGWTDADIKESGQSPAQLMRSEAVKLIRLSDTPRRRATMKREKEQMGKGFSSRSKKLQKMLEDNPVYKKRNRKKGGKVGRPKGVGCAKRGYGKAMKRGK